MDARLRELLDTTIAQNESMDIKIAGQVQRARKPDTTLKVIDADTIEDTLSGQRFRLNYVDTPETIEGSDKAKKVGVDTSIKGTSLVQQAVDNGLITAEDLYDRSTSKDAYGRNLVNFPELADEIIRRGEGVPSSKFDEKRQELYRAYDRKQKELYGEGNSDLEKLRQYNIDNYSATSGVADRAGNLVDALQSRGVQIGAEIGDAVLDIGKYGVATFANSILDDKNKLDKNSDLLEEWKNTENTDRVFGYDNRDTQFNMNEAAHQFLMGNYGEAIGYSLINSPELIVESLPTMAVISNGFGTLTKLNKATSFVGNLVNNNKGLLTWATGATNTAIEERMKNNDNNYVSFGEGVGIFTEKVLEGALDRFTFQNILKQSEMFKALKDTFKATGDSELGTSLTVKALKELKDIVTESAKITAKGSYAGVKEGTQELIQAYGDLLATKLGTDKFGNEFIGSSPEDQKRLITEALAGFGAGAVTHTIADTIQTTAKNVTDKFKNIGKDTEDITDVPPAKPVEPVKPTTNDNSSVDVTEPPVEPIKPVKEDADKEPKKEIDLEEDLAIGRDIIDKNGNVDKIALTELTTSIKNSETSSIGDELDNLVNSYNNDIGENDITSPEYKPVHDTYIKKFRKIGEKLTNNYNTHLMQNAAKILQTLSKYNINITDLDNQELPKELSNLDKSVIKPIINTLRDYNNTLLFMAELGNEFDTDLLAKVESHFNSLDSTTIANIFNNSKKPDVLKKVLKSERLQDILENVQKYREQYTNLQKTSKLGKKVLDDIWYGTDGFKGIFEHEMELLDSGKSLEEIDNSSYNDFVQSRVDKYEAFKSAVSEAKRLNEPVVVTGNSRSNDGKWNTVDKNGRQDTNKKLTAYPRTSDGLLNVLKEEADFVTKRFDEFKKEYKKGKILNVHTEGNATNQVNKKQSVVPTDITDVKSTDSDIITDKIDNKKGTKSDTNKKPKNIISKVLGELKKASSSNDVKKIALENREEIDKLPKPIRNRIKKEIGKKQLKFIQISKSKPSLIDRLVAAWKKVNTLIKYHLNNIKKNRKTSKSIQKVLDAKYKAIEKLLKDKEVLIKERKELQGRYKDAIKEKDIAKVDLNEFKKDEKRYKKLVNDLYKYIASINKRISKTVNEQRVNNKEIQDINDEIRPLRDAITRLKDIQSEANIEVSSSTNSVRRLKRTKEKILKEYKARIAKSNLFTDKVIDKLNTIDKKFYLKVKAHAGNIPKGFKLDRKSDIDKLILLQQNLNYIDVNKIAKTDAEKKYFQEVLLPIISLVRASIMKITPYKQLEAMGRKFGKLDEFLEYNKFLRKFANRNKAQQNLLINLTAFNVINSFISDSGELGSINTNEDIAKILSLNSEYEVTKKMSNLLANVGKLQTHTVENMVNSAANYIKFVSTIPFGVTKLNTAIALLALNTLLNSGVYTKIAIDAQTFNDLANIESKGDEGKKKVNFIHTLNTLPDLFKRLNSEGKELVTKLFSIDFKGVFVTPQSVSKDAKYKGTNVKLSDNTRKAIEKQQNTARQLRSDIVELYNSMNESDFISFLKDVLGYDYRLEKDIHVSRRASVYGKNLQIAKAITDLIDVIKEHGTNKLYFKYEAKGETRVHLESSTFQPQKTKLHRFLSHSENTTRELNVDDTDKMFVWKSAILDGLGYDTSKLSSLNDVDRIFDELLSSPEIMQFISNNTIIDANLLHFLVNNFGEEAHSIQALLELRNFYNNIKSDGTFITSLDKETDAKTSGSTLQSIFYANPLDKKSTDMLHRGGIFTKDTDATNNYEYTEPDNYETAAIELNNNINNKDIKLNSDTVDNLGSDKHNASVKDIMSFNFLRNVLPQLIGSWINEGNLVASKLLSDGRKYFKQPVTAVGYSAGELSVRNGKFYDLLDTFYGKLENIANQKATIEEVSDTLELVTSIMNLTEHNGKNLAMIARNGKYYQPINDKGLNEVRTILNKIVKDPNHINTKSLEKLNEFMFDSFTLKNIREAFDDRYGVILNNSINNTLSVLQDGTKLLTAVSNIHNNYFLSKFFDRILEEYNTNGFIDENTIKDITDELIAKGIAPTFKTFNGVDIPLLKKGFNDRIQQFLEENNFKIKVATKNAQNKNDWASQTIKVKTFKDLGVKAPAITTLATDASIMDRTANLVPNDRVGIFIFDAILSATGESKIYNQVINELIESNHIPAVDSIEKLQKALEGVSITPELISTLLPSIYSSETNHEMVNLLYKDYQQHKDIDILLGNIATIQVVQGDIYYDHIPITFYKELLLLHRNQLRNIVTHIDHSVGINDVYDRQPNGKVDIQAYQDLYNKYSKYREAKDVSKLERDISNYTKTDIIVKADNSKNILDAFGKKDSDLNELTREVAIIDKWLESNIDNYTKNTTKDIIDAIEESNDIIFKEVNRNKLKSYIANVRNLSDTRKSLDTDDTSFKEVNTFEVTRENIQEVFDTIDSIDTNKHSPEHTTMLKNLITRTILPVIDRIKVQLGTTSNILTYGTATGSNIAKVAIASENSNNLNMTGTEVYAHEMLHNILSNVLGSEEMDVFIAQIRDMMEVVRKTGKGYKLFLDINQEYSKEDIEIAKRMYNYVLAGSGNVAEFISYGLTNPNFMKSLASINTFNDAPFKGSLITKIVNIMKNAINRLKVLLTTGKIDNNYRGLLNTLVDRSLGISIAEHNKALNKAVKGIQLVHTKVNNTAIQPLVKGIDKLTTLMNTKYDKVLHNNHIKVLQIVNSMFPDVKDKSEFVQKLFNRDKKAILQLATVLTLNKIPITKGVLGTALFRGMMEELPKLRIMLGRSEIGNEFNILYDNIIKGAKDTEFAAKLLRESMKSIDQRREETRTLTRDTIQELIDIIAKSDKDEQFIFDSVIRSGMYSLVDYYDIDTIISFMTNKKELLTNIDKLKSTIPVDVIPAVKKLAKYRLNGTGKTAYRNSYALSRYESNRILNYRTIDTLTALYTMKEVSESTDTLSDNSDTFYKLLKYTKGIYHEYRRDVYKGNRVNTIDGDVFENTSNTKRLKYILSNNLSEIQIVKEVGGKYIKTINNPFDTKKSIKVYAVTNMMEGYTRGAMVYGDKSKKTTLYNLYRELYGESIGKDDFNNILKKTSSNGVLYPIYTNDGAIINYAVKPLSYSEENKYLNHTSSVAEALGNTKARVGEQKVAENINERVVDTIILHALDNKNLKNPKDWITISSEDKEYMFVWNMLPKATRKYIEKNYQGELKIPRAGRIRHILLGDTDATISKLTPKGKIRRFVKYAEDMWKELMGLWKIQIVIKMPQVLATNMVSNLVHTSNLGYSPIDIVKYQTEGFYALNAYITDTKELKAIQLDKDSGLPYDQYRYGELKVKTLENKIAPLIEKGLLSSFFEDINGSEVFKNITPIKDNIDRVIDLLPNSVIRLGKELYLTDSTEYYKFMYRMTQASDFIARYAQMRLMEQDTTHNYTDEYIHNAILDDYIQYDLPDGKFVRWFDSVSIIPFQKYYLRIQKVLHRVFFKHTANIIGMKMLQGATVNIEDPFDSSWIIKHPTDKIKNPFDNLDDLLTPVPVQLFL